MKNTLGNTKKTAYSCYFEVQLNPIDFGKSRNDHNRICNEQLLIHIESLQKEGVQLDPNISNGMIIDRILKEKNKSPRHFTWEHCATRTTNGRKGIMRLVPETQHTPGSEFQHIFHGEVNRRGGYHEWAVPAGAPVPLSKTNTYLQKYKSVEISSASKENIHFYIEKAVRTNDFNDFQSALNRATSILPPSQVSQIFTHQIANNDSLLHIAAANGHLPMIQTILSHITNPTTAIAATNYAQNTVAHIAAYNNRASVVQILVRHGADLTVKNKKNESSNEILRSISYSTQTSSMRALSEPEHEEISRSQARDIKAQLKPPPPPPPPPPPRHPSIKKPDSALLKSAPSSNATADYKQKPVTFHDFVHRYTCTDQFAPQASPALQYPQPKNFTEFANRFTCTDQFAPQASPALQYPQPQTFHEFINRYTLNPNPPELNQPAIEPELITVQHLMRPRPNPSAVILNSRAYCEQHSLNVPQPVPQPQKKQNIPVSSTQSVKRNLEASTQKANQQTQQQQSSHSLNSIFQHRYASQSAPNSPRPVPLASSISEPSCGVKQASQEHKTSDTSHNSYQPKRELSHHHQDSPMHHPMHSAQIHSNSTQIPLRNQPIHQAHAAQNHTHNTNQQHVQQKLNSALQRPQSNLKFKNTTPLRSQTAKQPQMQQRAQPQVQRIQPQAQQQTQQRTQQQAQQRTQQQAQQRTQQQAQQRAQQQAQQRAQQQAQQRAQQQAQQLAAQKAAQQAAQLAAQQRAAQQAQAAAQQRAAQQAQAAAQQRAAQQAQAAAQQRAAQQAQAAAQQRAAQQAMASRGRR